MVHVGKYVDDKKMILGARGTIYCPWVSKPVIRDLKLVMASCYDKTLKTTSGLKTKNYVLWN